MGSYTVARYLRISDEDQDMKQAGKAESDSISNQRNLLADFISRVPEFEGAEVLEFCDDGWSGKNFERPAVREMLEQVKRGKIQCIVVKDLSRFGRDYLTVGNYISRVFPFMGVRFIAVNDGFDSIRGADIDSLETSFKTLLYDLYSRDLSRKVRHAKKFKAERGEFLSPYAPYGYVKDVNDRHRLVKDPEAAGTVRRIFHMAAEGASTQQIAWTLNREQVKTPSLYKKEAGCTRKEWKTINEENFWTHTAVTEILRDERYVGKTVYGKHTRDMVGSPHVVGVKRADWITVDNTHEGIVTREEFARAQEQLRIFMERTGVSPGSRGTTLYKKVRCGACGHMMERRRTKEPYYFCRTSNVTADYACNGGHISENDLLETILAQLQIQSLYAVEIGRIWEEKHKRKKCDEIVIRKTISRLKETLTGLESQIRVLYEKFAFGELGKEAYIAAKCDVVEKRDKTSAKIQELEAELENSGADDRIDNRYTDHFGKYAEIKELTAEIVSDVLQEIVVYPDNTLNIVWNYQEDLEHLLADMETDSDKSSV